MQAPLKHGLCTNQTMQTSFGQSCGGHSSPDPGHKEFRKTQTKNELEPQWQCVALPQGYIDHPHSSRSLMKKCCMVRRGERTNVLDFHTWQIVDKAFLQQRGLMPSIRKVADIPGLDVIGESSSATVCMKIPVQSTPLCCLRLASTPPIRLTHVRSGQDLQSWAFFVGGFV